MKMLAEHKAIHTSGGLNLNVKEEYLLMKCLMEGARV